MGMGESLKRFLRALLGRPDWVGPEEAAYRRIKSKGYEPRSIIDVGAYQGEWTRLARKVFPDAAVLMVEAQTGKRPFLDKVCSELANVAYRSAALGTTAGDEVSFFEMETGSSLLPERSNVVRREVRLRTQRLDDIADDVEGPLFLKIDVQGAELQVLGGAEQTLAKADLVQLEVALLPYNEGAPTILEVLSYMDARGFVPLDICGFSRPNEVDLVQIDVLFVRRDSPLRPDFFAF